MTLDEQTPTGSPRLDLMSSASPLKSVIVSATVIGLVAVGFAHRDNVVLAVLLCGAVAAYGLLSIIDAAEQRLPNRITLPMAAATMVLVLVGGVQRSDIAAGLGAMAIGLAYASLLFLLRFGMGDVKMALTVGTIAGWLGRDALMTTMLAGAVSGAVVALGLMAVHRRRDLTFSYGPFLAIGSVVGMITAGG